MFSWKFSWLTVLTFTVFFDFFSYAAKAAANAFFGTASEALDPSETPLGPLSQAASRDGRATAPAPSAAPRSSVRRDIRSPAVSPYAPEPLNVDRAMSPSSGVEPNRTEREWWDLTSQLPCQSRDLAGRGTTVTAPLPTEFNKPYRKHSPVTGT